MIKNEWIVKNIYQEDLLKIKMKHFKLTNITKCFKFFVNNFKKIKF